MQKFIFLSLFVIFFSFSEQKPKTYYFHPTLGNDANSGITINAPFKSLSKIKTLKINPGDSLLLAINQTFNESLELIEINGSKQHPIVVSVYGKRYKSDKAFIKTEKELNGILVENSNFIEISNLRISANPSQNQEIGLKNQMRCGVLVTATNPKTYEHLYLSDLIIKDVFYELQALHFETGEIHYFKNEDCKFGYRESVFKNELKMNL